MAPHRDDRSFTTYGWLASVWTLLVSFQYGWHISALNQIQAVLTCKGVADKSALHYGLPACIPMTDALFGTVTATLTVGGLLGSILSNAAMDRWGRKGATNASAALTALGALIMGISPSIASLVLGRFLVGVGAGGLCIVPIYISEIAPPQIKGNVGVLNQMAIVLGIMTTQIMGLLLATPSTWRFVLLISAALAVTQLVLSTSMVESPVWLRGLDRNAEAEAAVQKLWKGQANAPRDGDVEDPLLATIDEEVEERLKDPAAISILQLLKARELRRPLLIASFIMSAQQLSGINAVLYYSNAILSKTLPELGPYVSVAITIVNVIMTFPPIFLIERVGRKQLLYGSTVGALLSLLAVGYGLDAGWVTLSSVAILTFVTSFAVGLGPVPFVLLSEVSPFHAVSAVSSFALSLNWIVNFLVGQIFLPLRTLLSGGDVAREGRVFYVFAAALALAMFAFSRVYR